MPVTINGRIRVDRRRFPDPEKVKTYKKSGAKPQKDSLRSRAKRTKGRKYIDHGKLVKKKPFSEDYSLLGAHGYARAKGFAWMQSSDATRELVQATAKAIQWGLADAQSALMDLAWQNVGWNNMTGNAITGFWSCLYNTSGAATHFQNFWGHYNYKEPTSPKLQVGVHVNRKNKHKVRLYDKPTKWVSFPDWMVIQTSGNYAYEDARRELDEAANMVMPVGKGRNLVYQQSMRFVHAVEYRMKLDGENLLELVEKNARHTVRLCIQKYMKKGMIKSKYKNK